jgi:TP901 family phage tail tape measure protein
MSMKEMGLGIAFVAKDQATATIQRVHGGVERVRTSANAAGRSLQVAIGAGIATALTGGLSRLTKSAAEFELGLAKVKNVSSATAEDMVILRDAAYEAALRTQFSPQQVVDGLEQLASAGFRASEQVALLNQSLTLAEAGQITMTRSTATVATAVKLFGLAGEDQNVMVDKMLKTVNLFKLQAIDLENALAKTSGAVLTTNQGFDEMLIAVGLIKNVFPHAGESGNSVSRAMAGIANKSALLKKELGIDVVNTITGKVRPALDLFIELEEKSAEKMTNAAERAKFLDKVLGAFGKKGVAAAIGSLREEAKKTGKTMREVADDFRHQVANAKGTGEEFRKNLLSTFQGQVNILKGAFETVMVAIGEPLIQILQPIIKSIGAAVSNVARYIRDLPMEMKKTIGTALMLGAAFLTVAVGVAAVVAIVTLMGGAFVAALAAIAPVVLKVGAAIAGIAAFGAAVRANLGGIGDKLGAVFGGIKLLIQGVIQLFREGAFSGAVMQEMNAAGNGGIKQFAINIYALYYRASQFISGIREGFASMSDVIGSSFSALGDAIQRVATEFGMLGTAITDTVDDIPGDRFVATGRSIGETLGQIIATVVRVVSTAVSIFGFYLGGLRQTFERYGHVFTAFWDSILKLVSTLSSVFGDTFGKVDTALGTSGGKAESFAAMLGRAVGVVMVVVVKMATIVVRAITVLMEMWGALKQIVLYVAGIIETVLTAITNRISGVVDGITNMYDTIKEAVSGTVLEGATGLIDFVTGTEDPEPVAMAPSRAVETIVNAASPAGTARDMGPTIAAGTRGATLDRATLQRWFSDIKIALVVDGETLANTVSRSSRDQAGRRFEAEPLVP